ncbi:MAG: DUF4850 domain-containing protein [Nocardiopsaceae bacterium]|nr:DUF4850 domain-containing protein [Nocardiopsaceae bacterium]
MIPGIALVTAAALSGGCSGSSPGNGQATGGTRPSSATAGLSKRGPVHGFSVAVPHGWRYRNETQPSDHTTDVFYDPADPGRRLVLVASNCAGCAANSGGTGRSPLNVLPAGSFRASRLSAVAAAYERKLPGNRYPGNGLAEIPRSQQSASGFITAEVYLPAGSHGLATAILNSVRSCWC